MQIGKKRQPSMHRSDYRRFLCDHLYKVSEFSHDPDRYVKNKIRRRKYKKIMLGSNLFS